MGQAHVLCVVAVLLASAPAWAQQKTQEEIEKEAMKERIKALEDRMKSMPQPGKDPEVSVTFKDGFKFKSADGNFEGHIGGRALVHFRDIVDRHEDSNRTSTDQFFVRQARLEATMTFWKDWEVKVQADFPTGASSTSGTLQDGFILWKRLPELNVRIGQFKEPFSQEESTPTRFIDFCERSVVNRLAPARDIGIMVQGKLFDNMFEYELGAFNGAGRAVNDVNDEKELCARLRVNPFVSSEDGSLFKGLRIGVSFSVQDVDSAGIDALDLTTTELAVKFLDATAGLIDGHRQRIGVELSWVHQSLSVRAEWAQRSDEVLLGASDVDIDVNGWYFAATWIITGEKKALENRLTPANPFDLSKGDWGAFELAVRVASLDGGDIIDELLASSTLNAEKVTTITVGINWWPTKNVRISPNFILENYSDDVTFTGPVEQEDSVTGFIVRFQMDF